MTYRILTLDGGGSWALIEVRALMKIYGGGATGHQVLKDFDLVAANSGGSLVLAGLLENLSLNAILEYFLDENKLKDVFSYNGDIGDSVLRGLLHLGPKYSAQHKYGAIRRLIPKTGDMRLAGIANRIIGPNAEPVHILIVSFDYDRNRAVFFRSAPANRPNWGEGQPAAVTLAGAVHASTNAPVNYFDGPASLPNIPDRYWDGGVTGCNNPVAAAVIEAIVLGQKPSNIRALSLGTGNVSLPLAAPGAEPGELEAPRSETSIANDIRKLATAILDDPPDAASFIAHAITGADLDPRDAIKRRVIRMSPQPSPLPLQGGGWTPPAQWSVEQFKYLCTRDMDAVEPLEVTYIRDYCDAWLADQAPNQAIRPNGSKFDPMQPELGHARFSEALRGMARIFSFAARERSGACRDRLNTTGFTRAGRVGPPHNPRCSRRPLRARASDSRRRPAAGAGRRIHARSKS